MLRSFLSGLALFGFLLIAGCDGGGPDSGIECDSGYTSDGTLTASTSDGAFRASCITVERNAIDGFVVGGFSSGEAGGVPQLIAVMGVSTGLPDVGTYSIGDADDDFAGGSYELLADPPAGTFDNEAVSGTVTLSEVTATRIRGTFSFVTGQGKSVSSGRFDAPY